MSGGRLVYMCATRRRKGPARCQNDRQISAADLDAAVLEALQQHALDPALIEAVVDTLDAPPDTTRLRADIATAERDMAGLIQLAKLATDVPQVAAEISKTNAQLI